MVDAIDLEYRLCSAKFPFHLFPPPAKPQGQTCTAKLKLEKMGLQLTKVNTVRLTRGWILSRFGSQPSNFDN